MKALCCRFTMIWTLSLLSCGTEVGNGNKVGRWTMPGETPDEHAKDKAPSESLVYESEIAADIVEVLLRLVMNTCAMPMIDFKQSSDEWVVVEASQMKALVEQRVVVTKDNGVWSAVYAEGSSVGDDLVLMYNPSEDLLTKKSAGASSHPSPATCGAVSDASSVEIEGETFLQNSVILSFGESEKWLYTWSYQQINSHAELKRLHFEKVGATPADIVVLEKH